MHEYHRPRRHRIGFATLAALTAAWGGATVTALDPPAIAAAPGAGACCLPSRNAFGTDKALVEQVGRDAVGAERIQGNPVESDPVARVAHQPHVGHGEGRPESAQRSPQRGARVSHQPQVRPRF